MQLLNKKAQQISIGDSEAAIKDLLGSPQRIFASTQYANTKLLYYCNFSFANNDGVGFYLYKNTVYRIARSLKPETLAGTGLSTRNVGKMDCYSSVSMRWSASLEPPALKDQRLAENRETQRRNQEANRRMLEEKREQELRKALIKTQEYFIDGLVINSTVDEGANCASGTDSQIKLSGAIGPDSSFALEELLIRSPNCLNEEGNLISRTRVELDSLGGYLNDGYKMGQLMRDNGVETFVPDNAICASSCAVAFLGGVDRVMEDSSIIMFHSPYLPGLNALGERVANCDIGSETTTTLLNYYQKMTSNEQGERLFNRTMSYCSAEDGWVLKGSAAAELFGVATEI
ncbi:hypothetical protein OAS20_02520 [Gammaproteobacteria bacterium]|nr:hypothetical protein [Gammaproteobacteria bacterium]